MDCEKIQTFLSQYLDKELDEDLRKKVRDHLLVCKACGNAYFSMKSVVEELESLEKIKAPDDFLDSVKQAVDKRSWFKNIFNIFSGYKIPMELVTLATTAILIFLIFTNLRPDKNDSSRILDPGQIQTASESSSDLIINGTKPVSLDFYINDIKESKHVASDNVVTVGSGKNFSQTDIPDFFEEINDDFPLLHREKAISHINKVILLMDGDVVSKDNQVDSAFPEIVTIKIPSGNYNSFIDEIEKVGRFRPLAPSLSDNSSDFVFLKMRFNLSE